MKKPKGEREMVVIKVKHHDVKMFVKEVKANKVRLGWEVVNFPNIN